MRDISKLLVAAFVAALATGLAAAAEPEKAGPAGKGPQAIKAPHMSMGPAPTSGSMPKGPAPKGKLGTAPTARGKLGTDPKPGESRSRPPRFN